jgi:HK97 family phage major capsid protein
MAATLIGPLPDGPRWRPTGKTRSLRPSACTPADRPRCAAKHQDSTPVVITARGIIAAQSFSWRLKMPNIHAIKQRYAELGQETRRKIDDLEHDRVSVKSFEGWWNRAEAEADQLRAGIKAYNHALSYRGGSDLNANGYTAPPDVRAKGRAPAVIFSDDDYRQAWACAQQKAGFSLGTKDYGADVVTKAGGARVSGGGEPPPPTVGGLGFNQGDGGGISAMLPAQLHPIITAAIHEMRLADHLPALAMSAPAYQFNRDVGSTGAPAVTAEGALKPEVDVVLDKLILEAVKIAGQSAVSWETWTDYDRFVQYLQMEIPRKIVDVENQKLLYGTGTGGDIQGLLTVPGILTHTASGTNPFDDIEESIAAMRVGQALATPDVLVLNPATWSATRRTKDNYGRYLVSPDPSKDEVNTAWGVEVVSTTAMAAGTGLLIDTTKFSAVLIREGLVIRTGSINDDFARNLVRFVFEERINVAVERPTALLKISGLPTSIGGS